MLSARLALLETSGICETDAFDTLAGSRLPDADALRGVAAEVRQEVERIAAAKARQLFGPVLRLWRAKYLRRILTKAAGTPDITITETLKRSTLIERWPEAHVERLAEQGVWQAIRDGEVVIHEGENSGSGIWVLLRGRVRVIKNQTGTKSIKSPGNRVVVELEAPVVLGDFTQLTEQPRTASVVSVGECQGVTIPKSVFIKELEQLPNAVQRHVFVTAFAERRAVMWAMFPMRPADFRKSFLFQAFTDRQLLQLQNRLKPCCYRQGQELCSFGESGNEMFFLRRGEVEVLVPQNPVQESVEDDPFSPLGDASLADARSNSSLSSGADREELPRQRTRTTTSSPKASPTRASLQPSWSGGHAVQLHAVARLKTGATFGEMSLVFGERRSATIRAVTHCDVWSLLFSDLEICFGDGDIRFKVRDAANAQRLQWLRDGQAASIKAVDELLVQPKRHEEPLPDVVYRERLLGLQQDVLLQAVLRCPILGDACSTHCLAEIRRGLNPKVYSPGDAITSKSETADRLLVMARGKALVLDPQALSKQYLHIGDMVGFTCLAEHRWLHAVTAWVTCDCWELPRDQLIQILKRHESLQRAQTLVRRLLTGQRPIPDASQLTPPLFPRFADDARDGHVRMLGLTESPRRTSDLHTPRRPSDARRASDAQTPRSVGSAKDAEDQASPHGIPVPATLLADDGALSPAARERRAILRQSFSKGLATRRASQGTTGSPGSPDGMGEMAAALEARVEAVSKRVAQKGDALVRRTSRSGAELPTPPPSARPAPDTTQHSPPPQVPGLGVEQWPVESPRSPLTPQQAGATRQQLHEAGSAALALLFKRGIGAAFAPPLPVALPRKARLRGVVAECGRIAASPGGERGRRRLLSPLSNTRRYHAGTTTIA